MASFTVGFTESKESLQPLDTEETFYIADGAKFSHIKDRANQKWPEAYTDLFLSVEHFQTRNIGYDLYDSSDYTAYLAITRITE